MTRKKITNLASLAEKLTGGPPMAYRLREDGSLVVIDAQGAKHDFTPAQVRQAAQPAASAAQSAKEEAA